jgi:hypothetical protein
MTEAALTVKILKPARNKAPRPAPKKIARIESHIIFLY